MENLPGFRQPDIWLTLKFNLLLLPLSGGRRAKECRLLLVMESGPQLTASRKTGPTTV